MVPRFEETLTRNATKIPQTSSHFGNSLFPDRTGGGGGRWAPFENIGNRSNRIEISEKEFLPARTERADASRE